MKDVYEVRVFSTENEPTERDINSPKFQAVWQCIKGWDIQRTPDEGYAHATGTDVMLILNALREKAVI